MPESRFRRWSATWLVVATALTGLTACEESVPASPPGAVRRSTSPTVPPPPPPRATPMAHRPSPFYDPLPGMPPALPGGVYAAAGPGMIQPALRHQPRLIYVPDSEIGGHTTVISHGPLASSGCCRPARSTTT